MKLCHSVYQLLVGKRSDIAIFIVSESLKGALSQQSRKCYIFVIFYLAILWLCHYLSFNLAKSHCFWRRLYTLIGELLTRTSKDKNSKDLVGPREWAILSTASAMAAGYGIFRRCQLGSNIYIARISKKWRCNQSGQA